MPPPSPATGVELNCFFLLINVSFRPNINLRNFATENVNSLALYSIRYQPGYITAITAELQSFNCELLLCVLNSYSSILAILFNMCFFLSLLILLYLLSPSEEIHVLTHKDIDFSGYFMIFGQLQGWSDNTVSMPMGGRTCAKIKVFYTACFLIGWNLSMIVCNLSLFCNYLPHIDCL